MSVRKEANKNNRNKGKKKGEEERQEVLVIPHLTSNIDKFDEYVD